MTAGHILMHILAGGLLNIFKIPYFGLIGIIPLFIFILVCLMELGISILQAYVFIVLVILYFNESVQTNSHQNTKLIFKHENYIFYEFFNYMVERKYLFTFNILPKTFTNKKFLKRFLVLRFSKRLLKELAYLIIKKVPEAYLFTLRKNPNIFLLKKMLNI